MGRRVFLSFLGYSNYGRCRYVYGDFKSEDLRFIQEATLDYLIQKEEWGGEDVAYILLTEGAKAKNWVDDGQINAITKEVIKQEGLDSRLKRKKYPFKIETIENIPDGKTEGEMLEIFKRMYEVLQPGDVLYFDVTHGFRSLPMLALVLINYAKFLLDVEVRCVTYGNFEARNVIGKHEDGTIMCEAPIIDLMQLSQIQDWTFAAADYLKNGNADRFAKLADTYKRSIFSGSKDGDKEQANAINGLAQSLNKVTDEFQTCRGIDILKSCNIKILKDRLSKIGKTIVEPLNPVIEKMDDMFKDFSVEDELSVRNGFEAARWCINHNLYQQAATILQENVVTFFCLRHGLNIYDDKERGYVNQVMRVMQDSYSQKPKGLSCDKTNPHVESLISDDLIIDKEVCCAFGSITEERNDINHEGMRTNPHSSKKIRENIKGALDTLYQKLVLEKLR